MQFRKWLETSDYTTTFVRPKQQLQQLQRTFLHKALNRGDQEWAGEIAGRMAGNAPQDYADALDDLPDLDDKGNPIKRGKVPYTFADWQKNKGIMLKRAIRDGDLAMVQSILDDLEKGFGVSAAGEDDDEVNVLSSPQMNGSSRRTPEPSPIMRTPWNDSATITHRRIA